MVRHPLEHVNVIKTTISCLRIIQNTIILGLKLCVLGAYVALEVEIVRRSERRRQRVRPGFHSKLCANPR